MLPKALLAAALASSTASALLLPPPIDVEFERQSQRGGKNGEAMADAPAAMKIGTVVPAAMAGPFYHEFTKVKVPCPGCSMQIRKHGHGHEEDNDDNSETTEEGQIVTLTNVDNHINLFLKIDHQADGDHLLVNHFEVYPNVDINGDGLMATQAPDHFHHKGKHHKGKHHKGKHHEEHEHEHDHEHEHEHEHDDHGEELKKRHRKHHADDEGFEAKHWKHKEFKDGKDFHLKKHHGKHGKHLVKVPLGYAMQTKAVGKDESNGMEAVALSLEIIQVNGEFIRGIPAVNIHLIRTPESGLMIARVDIEGDGEVAAPPAEDRMAELKEQLDACSNFLCRWKVLIKSGIKAHRGGCAGKAMAKAFGGKGDGDDEDKPHRHHHHHHHHHHHDEDDENDTHEDKPHRHHKLMRHHSWAKLARKFVSHILLPILFGVATGIAVSVIGVAVGTFVAGAWRVLFRRKAVGHTRRCCKSKKTAAAAVDRHGDEAAVDEEKAGLMAAPSIEELPPYEDDDAKSNSA
ncbi:hypothetical protein SPBR_04945 [Sporothrix brasiliensis 5110]|uniref:DUF7728 domain-containing protein n=1 Tax=Sporothrix brasiliensis 5110 TaxID=1398154 RepID=A0A0C2IQJ6_9PEZI|nr:uncharacterized protein SPBR_04945 [Sporothrix brasiliensis 5110]KIH87332.1 hypothetical protein SPBR_04945 [Sporothrix brasiliensis 5110]